MTNNELANEYITLFNDMYDILEVNEEDINDFFTYLTSQIPLNDDTIKAVNITDNYIRNFKKENVIKNDFIITIDYSVNDKNVIISAENTAGIKYTCNNTNDLKYAINDYIEYYIEEGDE